MDGQTVALVFSIIGVAASLIFAAGRIKATVDTHGNAIGESKRRLDAHEASIKEHHGRISRIEGRSGS